MDGRVRLTINVLSQSLRNTAHSNPRPSDQKPEAPMEAMVASGSRLCQIIQGASLRPRTAQRFQTVLATACIVALADAGFASRMDGMMVNSIRKFAAVKKRVAKAPTSLASHHAHARGRDAASLTYCSSLCVYDRWAQQVVGPPVMQPKAGAVKAPELSPRGRGRCSNQTSRSCTS